jgi:hypothetical protein
MAGYHGGPVEVVCQDDGSWSTYGECVPTSSPCPSGELQMCKKNVSALALAVTCSSALQLGFYGQSSKVDVLPVED